MTDTFKRIKTSTDGMQCGCHWERRYGMGDVLIQCPIHKQASDALVKKFERARKPLTIAQEEMARACHLRNNPDEASD